jgi:hypothetical protein
VLVIAIAFAIVVAPSADALHGLCVPAGSCNGPAVIALGGNKQASINVFKGRQFVDLREYYNAGALQEARR